MKDRFDYSEVLRLKAACAERFPDHVHFHDGCGGQYFNLDEKNDGSSANTLRGRECARISLRTRLLSRFLEKTDHKASFLEITADK